MSATAKREVEQEVILFDPAEIAVESNVRFGLKPSRVDDLAEKIKEVGRITTPLWVEEIENPTNGHKVRLLAGNYRKAAVEKLNQEGAGLKLPCLIVDGGDPVTRLKLQLSENMDRENQSPMDMAIAIKQLFDAGVPRIEIRKLFSRPGGRKGNKKAPASNSYINMMMTFLQFPKAIQAKIHAGPDQGGIGVATAYELTKIPREKWETVLAKAEQDRVESLAREEKDEAKYEENERKLAEQQEKANKLSEELAAQKAQFEEVSRELDTVNEEAAKLYSVAKTSKVEEEKAAAQTKVKELEDSAKEKVKAATELKKAVESLEKKHESASKLAEERAAKLRELRLAKPTTSKAKAPGPQDVKKAAAATGASQNYVPLNATDMRRVVNELLAISINPKVKTIGCALKSAYAGIITENELHSAIGVVTGEVKKLQPGIRMKDPELYKMLGGKE